MVTPTMMKRSGVGGACDVPTSPEQTAPGPNLLSEAKVIWVTDPTAVVGPREEEVRRRGPEMQLLFTVSALLTLMVLWGIFREVHVFVPKVLRSVGAITQVEEPQQPEKMEGLHPDHIHGVGVATLQEEDFKSVGHARKEEKHLLEVQPEQVVVKKNPPRKIGSPRQVSKKQKGESTNGGLPLPRVVFI